MKSVKVLFLVPLLFILVISSPSSFAVFKIITCGVEPGTSFPDGDQYEEATCIAILNVEDWEYDNINPSPNEDYFSLVVNASYSSSAGSFAFDDPYYSQHYSLEPQGDSEADVKFVNQMTYSCTNGTCWYDLTQQASVDIWAYEVYPCGYQPGYQCKIHYDVEPLQVSGTQLYFDGTYEPVQDGMKSVTIVRD